MPQNLPKSSPYNSTVHTDKSKVNISQNFVALSEYMNSLNLFEEHHYYFYLEGEQKKLP